MDEDKNTILKSILESAEAEGNYTKSYTTESIASSLGIEKAEAKKQLSYLSSQGFLEETGRNWQEISYKLTSKGINQAEGKTSIDHFNPVQVNQTFNAAVASVQTGQGSTANITQNIGLNQNEVSDLVSQLALNIGDLPEDKQEDMADVLESLKKVLAQEQPDKEEAGRFIKMLKRASQAIGDSTKYAKTLTTLIDKLQEMGLL